MTRIALMMVLLFCSAGVSTAQARPVDDMPFSTNSRADREARLSGAHDTESGARRIASNYEVSTLLGGVKVEYDCAADSNWCLSRVTDSANGVVCYSLRGSTNNLSCVKIGH